MQLFDVKLYTLFYYKFKSKFKLRKILFLRFFEVNFSKSLIKKFNAKIKRVHDFSDFCGEFFAYN